MPAAERAFVDTNLWVYTALTKPGDAKCAAARQLLQQPLEWVVSGQVLAELSNVLLRHGLSRSDIEQQLHIVVAGCEVHPVTLPTVQEALRLKERYGHSFYDALIVASALLSDCAILYTEDLQHGLIVEKTLRVSSPFA